MKAADGELAAIWIATEDRRAVSDAAHEFEQDDALVR
jgi:hypothetical protein